MTRVYRCALAMAILLTAVRVPAVAQDPAPGGQSYTAPVPFKVDPTDKKKFRDLEKNKSNVLRGISAFNAEGQAHVKEWFEGYVFPAMTNPDYYHEIGEMRREITRDLQSMKQQEVHDSLVQMLFNNMKKMVDANFPPPTRINGLLLISELNSVERGTTTEAVPYAAALPYLRQKLNDADESDGVRLVALAGIHRHIESQWFANQKPEADLINGLRAEMLAIVTEATPPQGRSPDAHSWFRGRAADVLGSLCGWQPDPAAFEALSDILADDKAPISLRCRAAYAIGRFDYTKLAGTGDVKLDELTGNIAGLVADACKTEVTWLEKERDEVGTRRASGFGPSMMTGGIPGGATPGVTGATGAAIPFNRGGSAQGGGDDDEGSTTSAFPFPGGTGSSATTTKETGPQTGGVPRYVVDGARRRLLYELACVRESINGPGKDEKSIFKGLKKFTQNDAAAQSDLTKINEEVEKLRKILVKKDYKLNEILKEVRASMLTLQPMRPQPVAETSEVPVGEEGSDIPTGDEIPAGDEIPTESTEVAPPANGEVPAETEVPADTVPPDDAAAAGNRQ